MERWLEREIAQWVHPMKDRSDDPSHHERTLLPRSYISLPSKVISILADASKIIKAHIPPLDLFFKLASQTLSPPPPPPPPHCRGQSHWPGQWLGPREGVSETLKVCGDVKYGFPSLPFVTKYFTALFYITFM